MITRLRPLTIRSFLDAYPENGRVGIGHSAVYLPRKPGHVVVTVSTCSGHAQAQDTSLRRATRLAILRHEYARREEGSTPRLAIVRKRP